MPTLDVATWIGIATLCLIALWCGLYVYPVTRPAAEALGKPMLWILGGVGVVLSALSLRPKPKGTAPLPEPEPGAPTISAVTALQDSYAQGLAENVANAQASQEETAQIYEEATQTGDIRPLLERQRGARLRAAEIRATAARSHPSKG